MPIDQDVPSRVVSVNVGSLRDVEWNGRMVPTGIWKVPVEGPVALRGTGLVGDHQADPKVHGGPDKAVYAYSTDDYAYWAARESFAVHPGLFGENLTMEGLDLCEARVGERWRVGTALLEVAQPRMPCFKLGLRVGDQFFLKRFLEAVRPGAYLRIIEEGVVQAGDRVQVMSRPDHVVTMALMVESRQDPKKAELVQAAPNLPANWRQPRD